MRDDRINGRQRSRGQASTGPAFPRATNTGSSKAWLRLIVDEIRLDGNELKIRGSHDRQTHVHGLLEKKRLGEVPSLITTWRPVRDCSQLAL